MTESISQPLAGTQTDPTPSVQACRDQVVQVVQGALEEIGFMEILPAATPSPYDESVDRYRADILVNEPAPGEVRLIMPKPLLEKIAENVYAVEDDNVSEETLNDIMAEMINILAGGLMRLWAPDSQIFQLGLPSVGQEAFLKIDTLTDTIEFDMEGEPFWLVLRGAVFAQSPEGA